MVLNTALSSGILIAVALGVAVLAARKVSRPIQVLADTTHEIAAGKFNQRIEVLGPSQEIYELAEEEGLDLVEVAPNASPSASP